jgi:D-alanyl-D-alanine carboxypeptidase
MKHRKHDIALQRLLLRTLAEEPALRGAVLRVEAPAVDWAGAVGLCEPRDGLAMRAGDAFQIASITKTFTATLCLLLAEEGLVELDDGIGAYLPAAVTEGLHEVGGRSFGPALTLRQLLSHTSGLADFFGDGTPGADGTLPFVAEMAANPDRLWDPLEVVAWTKGNLSARFAPGAGWHYADTGFLLAGLVAEAVTGEALHDALRRRIFAPLGMDHTFMLHREPARPVVPGRPVSRPFAGDTDYGSLRSTSADWGSGGLVSTAGDLVRFLRALVEDRVFADPQSRRQMKTWVATGETGVSYGLGLRRFDLDALGLDGYGELWGHTGFLKSFMLYWPAGDAIFCGTLNQSHARGAFSGLRPVAALVRDVLPLLRPL